MAIGILDYMKVVFTDAKGGEIQVSSQGPESNFVYKPWVQQLIDDGKLMIVRTFTCEQWKANECCNDGDYGVTEWHGYPNFCPGCGAKITH